MAGHGGGAWKVAYADFVTAMMAFFMVMWITAQNDKVKEAIAHHFNEPFDSSIPSEFELAENTGGPNQFEPAMPSKGAVNRHPPAIAAPNDNQKDPESRRPRMLTLREGDRTRTGTVVFFGGESADLDQAAQERLKRLVPWIAGKPQKLEIRGHAARRPPSPDSPHQDSWQMSYARCVTVMKFLEQQGIAPERMRMSQAGGYEPCTLETVDRQHLQDARVEVYLLSELAQDYGQAQGRTQPEPSAEEERETTAAEKPH